MKTTLVIMAAGIGSRFGGGIKQLAAVGPNGEIIMDFSIHDAIEAGFDKIVFIIRRDIEQAFKEAIGDRIEATCAALGVEIGYAFQAMDAIPAGFTVPEGRTKPWGTGQAVLACKGLVKEPFAVINADDYYGPAAYREIFAYLSAHADGEYYEYAMVGFRLENTVSENGSVSRGVCVADEGGYLASVTERTRIEQYAGGIHYTENGGESWQDLPGDTTVSMNLFGFTPSFVQEVRAGFPAFLKGAMAENPLKGEYFLPSVVSRLIGEGKARVKVLTSPDKWYGVTYQQDKPLVVAALVAKTAEGLYPDGLWEN